MSDETDEQIKNTVYHELAHVLGIRLAIDLKLLFMNDTINRANTRDFIDKDKILVKKEDIKVDFCDHGTVWDQIAKQLSNNLNLKLSRTYNDVDHPKITQARKNKTKYILKYQGCGYEYCLNKFTDVVKYPERQRCSICNSRVVRIK